MAIAHCTTQNISAALAHSILGQRALHEHIC